MNEIIVGREKEIDILKKQFNKVLEGKSEISVIFGDSGIGKTSLVNNVIQELEYDDITYVYGKYRNYDQKPLSAISDIVEQIVKYLLMLPNKELTMVKKHLKKSSELDIEILVHINPYITMLLGDCKVINVSNYEKFKYRVKNSLLMFLKVISETLFPLVIFIDDLQWADSVSIKVIELILKNSEELNILFLLSFRDNKESYVDKLKNIIKIIKKREESCFINLNRLNEIDVCEYLRERFLLHENNQKVLGKLIYGLTLGKPFYIKEVIDLFINNNVIKYISLEKKWQVNIELMVGINLSDDIQMLIINKINNLSEKEKYVLELIACFDGMVKYDLLEKVSNIDNKKLEVELKRLCDIAVIIKNEEKESYTFVHDIVFESVYDLMDIEYKKKIHYDIVSNIFKNINEEFIKNNSILISSQILRAEYKLLIKENKEQLINILYYAGIDTKKKMAVEQALKIFELCVKLLTCCKLEDSKLNMKINLELGECKFICGKYKESNKIFESLIKKYNSIKDLIKIKKTYMNLYSYSGQHNKSIELGKQILNHLNYKFNTKSLTIEIFKGIFIFSNQKIEILTKIPKIKDKRLIEILEILNCMIPSACCVDEKVFQLIIIRIAMISIKYGNSEYSALGYGAYSHMINIILKDSNKARRLESVALELLEDVKDLSIKSTVHSFIGTFVDHWFNSFEISSKYLDKSIDEGIKSGEFMYSGYALVSNIYVKYVMGLSFNEIMNYVNLQKQNISKMGKDIVKFINYVLNIHVNYLKNELSIEENDEIKEELSKGKNSKVLIYKYFMCQRYYMESKLEEAYKLIEDIVDITHLLKGHIVYSDIIFYSTLIRLEYHNKIDKSKKHKNKKIIKSYIKELECYDKICSNNHHVRYLLLKAEYNKIFKDRQVSLYLYNEAISFAQSEGNIHLEALGNILLSKYYIDIKKISYFYIKEAIALYKKWGATYIANKLEKNYVLENIALKDDEDFEQECKIDNITIDIKQNLLSYINKIENMGEEEAYEYILNLIIKISDADYGAVLFEKSDEMYIKYEGKKNKNIVSYSSLRNIKSIKDISHKIIRYVARTGENIMLENRPVKGIFTKDNYVMGNNKISIICMPIKYLDVFVGEIYIEKKCDKGFDEKIIQSIKSVIPSLVLKKEIIKEINIKNILNPKKGESSLTDREIQLLELVAEGMSNSGISKEMHISVGTVKNHLSNVYSKLEVNSRIKAVVKAKELNIINI